MAQLTEHAVEKHIEKQKEDNILVKTQTELAIKDPIQSKKKKHKNSILDYLMVMCG